jgi:ATP-dependent DNA ligase
MALPHKPPLLPQLARPAKKLPVGVGWAYEPKWDGFRAIAFVDGTETYLQSRSGKPLRRYFPELTFPEGRYILDGEIVLFDAEGRQDFDALGNRLHPAPARVNLLAEQTPATFVAFDLLAVDDEDLTERPFSERRDRLAEIVGGLERRDVHLTPMTEHLDTAREWFEHFEGAGLDGLIAKKADLTYQPDKRVMSKIKHERTADCVVAGYRVHKSGPDAVGSLLLGLHTEDGALQSVGVIGAFPMAQRKELFAELQPLVTSFEGHPWAWAAQEEGTRTPREAEHSRWNAQKDLSFVPLRPERVVEVRYDHMEGVRFRHTAQFKRWRPDRDPASCTFAQLERPVRFDLAEVLIAR